MSIFYLIINLIKQMQTGLPRRLKQPSEFSFVLPIIPSITTDTRNIEVTCPIIKMTCLVFTHFMFSIRIDRICTALCTYRCTVCPLSTLYLFWVYLLEGNLSKRYASSRSYHQRCTSEIASPSSSHKIPFSEHELDQVLLLQCDFIGHSVLL